MQYCDRTGGNRDPTLGGHTQSNVCIGTQGKEQREKRLDGQEDKIQNGTLEYKSSEVELDIRV